MLQRRAAFLSSLLCLGLASAAQAAAAPRHPLFAPLSTESRPAAGTADLGVTRVRRVRAELAAFGQAGGPPGQEGEGRVLRLDLFDNVHETAVLDRVDRVQGGFAWVGHLEGAAFSSVVFVVREGTVTGSVHTPRETYSVRPDGAVHVVAEIDTTLLPSERDDAIAPARRPAGLSAPAPAPAPAAADDGGLVDLLVVYTAAMKSIVDGGVADTNTAYANSGVIQRLRLVHVEEITYNESGDLGTDLDRLTATGDGVMDTVHALRDQYKADVVQLVVDTNASSGGCGIAWLMPDTSVGDPASFQDSAFSVTERICIPGNYTFGHEIGHNLGLNHARQDPTGTGAFPYAFGYKDPGQAFRDIMAYDCAASCPRILNFSNPAVQHGGLPTGIDPNQPNGADNALALDNTRATTSNFRLSQVPLPPKATLVSPTGVIAQTSPTYVWNVASDATRYELWVNPPGSSVPVIDQFYDAAAVCGASTCSVRPGVVLVSGEHKWWIQASNSAGVGPWSVASKFTVSPPVSKGLLTTPVPGSTLTSPTVQFKWSAGQSVTQYNLKIDDASGATLFNAPQGLNLAVTVKGLPIDGQTLHARLGSLINGSWQYDDEDYTSVTAQTAQMQTPVAASTLPGSSVTFTWSAGQNVAEYWLSVGSSVGGTQFYDGTQALALSRTVSGLPTNGSTVWVRLWSRVGTGWLSTDMSYTAATLANRAAQMQTPAPSSVLAGTSVTFTWDAGVGVTQYWLSVGTTLGGTQIYDGSQGLGLSRTVSGLPSNGSTVYVRLFSRMPTWQHVDYTYTASSVVVVAPRVVSPVDGALLHGSSTTFTWNTGSGFAITQFWLSVGTTVGGTDLYDATQGLATSRTVSGLPTSGVRVYVRLWYRTATIKWQYTDTSYITGP
jgi:hypothetical protein